MEDYERESEREASDDKYLVKKKVKESKMPTAIAILYPQWKLIA